MKKKPQILREADFNPRIKGYIFAVTTFFLFISLIGIPLIIFWAAGFGQSFSRRYYKHLKCRLTETHLEFNKGVMFRVEKTIPLENIQDLTFLDNPFLRMFDLRILKIETAGSSNPQGSDMKLVGIMDTPAFKEAVLDQRSIIRNKNLSDDEPAGQAKGNRDESIALLKEIRDLLVKLNENR